MFCSLKYIKHGYYDNKKIILIYFVRYEWIVIEKNGKYNFIVYFVRYLRPKVVFVVFVILHFWTFLLVTISI
jgi:hypothetical protein